MTISDLVSLRFYLAAPALDPLNVAVLKRRLGSIVVTRGNPAARPPLANATIGS